MTPIQPPLAIITERRFGESWVAGGSNILFLDVYCVAKRSHIEHLRMIFLTFYKSIIILLFTTVIVIIKKILQKILVFEFLINICYLYIIVNF